MFAYFQKKPGKSILWTYYYLVLMLLITGCVGEVPSPTCAPQQPTVYPSQTIVLPSSAPMLPTPYPSNTPTFGPSPTSTLLPPLEDSTWISKPIMIEGAIINTDPESPFQYTPFFILYGDGKLIKRTCETGECRYLQAQLERESLCYVFNTVNRSGFLDADPLGFSVPTGTGTQIRLKVQVYKSNEVQIPDLDRWVQTPNWYNTYSGCQNCIDAPEVDPAFIDFYQLLTTYDDTGMTGAAIVIWQCESGIGSIPTPTTTITPTPTKTPTPIK